MSAFEEPERVLKRRRRARDALFRYLEQQQRLAELMGQLGRAVAPGLNDNSGVGFGYLGGETSLITEDLGFFC